MIREITEMDYARLMEIWQSAVINTHDFLKEEDFLYYKEMLPVYFKHVALSGFEKDGVLVGFIGTSKENLEMLFIDNDFRGTGIGKKLTAFAITNLKVSKVDVNEQNTQALNFYKHLGFKIVKRSALDEKGKEYPILHMEL
ncbi:GNAT family N-acetyltransferase [Flavobacterium sp. H4147]|uniref:GNAT family N-acetyltransferase n=1 Tax=Flavobacterium sp. H4147 TaxID=3034149 RepID=UPI0023EC2DFA|nr:GNAT family N-acetyltransferase [Flavobacterium sp. H4147]